MKIFTLDNILKVAVIIGILIFCYYVFFPGKKDNIPVQMDTAYTNRDKTITDLKVKLGVSEYARQIAEQELADIYAEESKITARQTIRRQTYNNLTPSEKDKYFLERVK